MRRLEEIASNKAGCWEVQWGTEVKDSPEQEIGGWVDTRMCTFHPLSLCLDFQCSAWSL